MMNDSKGSEMLETVIGLEVHAQLKTRTKLFCGCLSLYGDAPNSHTCPVCTGLPGALPALNGEAVRMAVVAGLALGCNISTRSVFARKNYFYPDCPKNYQISMYDDPLCVDGYLELDGEDGNKRIGIERVHLEEDAGKLLHEGEESSLIDFNRCGVPLIEIVTSPDIRSAREAASFVRRLRQLLRYLEICDGNLEEGSMRCDVNISLRKSGSSKLGTRTEIKNLNSFRAIEDGIEKEMIRQMELLDRGEIIDQITNLWDQGSKSLVMMRSKEEAHDYRYFPEPDLLPLVIEDEWIGQAREGIPELPKQRELRFENEYGLSAYDSGVLTAEREVADYFEEVARITGDAKTSCNWVMREVLGELKDSRSDIGGFSLKPERLASLIKLVNDGRVSLSAGREIFREMIDSGVEAPEAVERLGLEQISDTGLLEQMVDQVLEENEKETERFRNGESKLLDYFVGQVMKKSRGKANPSVVSGLIVRKLG